MCQATDPDADAGQSANAPTKHGWTPTWTNRPPGASTQTAGQVDADRGPAEVPQRARASAGAAAQVQADSFAAADQFCEHGVDPGVVRPGDVLLVPVGVVVVRGGLPHER
jgi:hypothetical protein